MNFSEIISLNTLLKFFVILTVDFLKLLLLYFSFSLSNPDKFLELNFLLLSPSTISSFVSCKILLIFISSVLFIFCSSLTLKILSPLIVDSLIVFLLLLFFLINNKSSSILSS